MVVVLRRWLTFSPVGEMGLVPGTASCLRADEHVVLRLVYDEEENKLDHLSPPP